MRAQAGAPAMGSGRALQTWGNRGRFTYVGHLDVGTKVMYGRGSSFIVEAAVYAELLTHFGGREVEIGLGMRPARDSLGAWLRGKTGIQGAAAYVGPILVNEGAAERTSAGTLFVRLS